MAKIKKVIKSDNENYKFERHGLTGTEVLKIVKQQKYKCPILGTNLEVNKNEHKIIDKDPKAKKRQSACVDHDHKSNIIRGILSDMGNQLVGGFDRGRYGNCDIPENIKNYLNNPSAKQCGITKYWS